MGMDVYGRNPTAPQGEYFRASIDQWPLLAKVINSWLTSPRLYERRVAFQSGRAQDRGGSGSFGFRV